jgi:transposase
MQYLGLDVHQSAIVWVLLNGSGDVVEHSKIDFSAKKLSALIQRLSKQETLQVGQEIGCQSTFVHDVVTAAGAKILSFNAYQLRMISSSRKKTDRRDAYWIAKCLQTGMMPHPVYVPTGVVRRLRSLLSQRDAITSEKRRWMLRARCYLRARGFVLPKRSRSITALYTHVSALPDGLDADLAESLEMCVRMERSLVTELNKLVKAIRKETKTIREIRQLMTIPGIGFLVATRFYACIGDASRFPNSSTIGSYIGLVPSVYNSGESERSGEITRQGSPALRSALIQSGHALIARCSPEKAGALKQHALRVMEHRRRRKIAVVAAAHKIARIAYHVMRNGKDFDLTLLRSVDKEVKEARMAG